MDREFHMFEVFEDATGAHCCISAQRAFDGEMMLRLADGTSVATVFIPPHKVPCIVRALMDAVGETETTSETSSTTETEE